MKRSLFALLLIGILLLSFGCSPAPEPGEAPATVDEAPDATADQPTETVPAVPEETEPETTAAPTEPATEATEPVTTTPPTEPSKPSQSTKPTTKPSETTQPTTAAKPSGGATPDQPKVSGWFDKDGKRYYRNSDGRLHTGWLSLDGERYYFYEDGSMAVGKVKIPGSGTRYFTSTGKECTLVNPWNYVPSDYSVKLSKYGDYKVAKSCLKDLKQMLADCKSAGSKAVVVSAYRSNSYQAGLYERRVQRFIDQGYSKEEAKTEAAKRVAVPGTSEHELGLAVDIVDVNYQTLDKKQENTAAQKWLMANSWKYGFILRYPNGKSSVTGIIYEPWHYRYVGKELAKELHNSGLCLEEYFASLS